MKKETMYYEGEKILSNNSTYNVVIGQRSNGKTYFFLEKALDYYMKTGIPSAYIRRYDESLTTTNAFKLMNPHTLTLQMLSEGKYNSFEYKSKTFYLTYVNDNGKVTKKSDPFLYCVGLNSWEHKKGQDRGEIKYIIFDEFLTRDCYLNDEFAKFMNLLSSLIRDRTDVTIIMLGNTVNKFCPYFQKFRIDMNKIKQGMIYNYKYGETTLSLEYCKESQNTSKTNKKYFDFPEKSLDMIKKGYWEINAYPQLYGGKIKESELIDSIYIQFTNIILRWDLYIDDDSNVFSFCSPSTINKAIESEKIFITQDQLILLDNKFAHSIIPSNRLTDILFDTYPDGKMFFSSDEIGDAFTNFLKETAKGKMTRF